MPTRPIKVAALAFVVTTFLAGCGGGSDDDSKAASTGEAAGTRTVAVDMVDHAYRPAQLSVRRGETVKFMFTNKGSAAHEAFIGDANEQLAYSKKVAEIAKSHQGAGGHTTTTHDDAGQPAHTHTTDHDDHPEGGIHLDPGKSGELSYTFSRAGEVEVACYEPGHLEAGMRMTITVA